jgi:hypothetical protein
MRDERKFLSEDTVHTNQASERWLAKYQFYSSDKPKNYIAVIQEKGSSPACFKCQYYIALSDNLGNETSPLDGKLMFEHDSCEAFSFAADEEEFKLDCIMVGIC